MRILAALLFCWLMALGAASAAPAEPSVAASARPGAAATSSRPAGAPATKARPAAKVGAAPAEEPTAPVKGSPTPTEEAPQFGGSDGINWGRQIALTMVWLLVICGMAFLILRVFYARAGMGGLGMGRRRLIQVHDRHVLSPQKALLVVEVAGRFLVIGVSEQTISTLAELRPEDVRGGTVQPAPGTPETSMPAAPPADFQAHLASLFGKRTPPG